MRHLRSIAVVSVLLALSPYVSAETSTGALLEWTEPTDEVVSPHIMWIKPDADGPLRVLFITYAGAMREIVELCERFEIAREVAAHHRQDLQWESGRNYQLQPFKGADGPSFEARLREKLAKDYDCIVIGDIPWKKLPDWARKTILEKVAGGTGLAGRVSTGKDEALRKVLSNKIDVDPSRLTGAFPFEGLPAFPRITSPTRFAKSRLTLAQHGKGRVALLKRMKMPVGQILTPGVTEPWPQFAMIDYDYYLALAGKVIRWAAGREGAARVMPDESFKREVDRTRFRAIAFQVTAARAIDVEAEFTLRRADTGAVTASGHRRVSLAKGDNTVSFEIEAVPAGEYFADLWLRQDEKTLDVGSRYLVVTSPSHIADVAFTPATIRVDEAPKGTVKVHAPEKGQTLAIEQSDAFGRIVTRITVPVTGEGETENVAFALPAGAPLSVLQNVTVRLRKGVDVLDERRTVFTYHDLYPPRDDVRYVIWPGFVSDSFLNAILARVCAAAGYDTLLVGGRQPNRVAGAACLGASVYPLPAAAGRPTAGPNMSVSPRPMGKRFEETKNGHARVPCLTASDYVQAQHNVYKETAHFWRDMCPPELNLGDECHFIPHGTSYNMCYSDTCIEAFRRFVQREYRDVARMNKAYGTNCESFDEVTPIDLDKARTAGPIPMWIDHQQCMSEVWASQFAFALSDVTAILPGAKVGYEGSNDPGHMPRILALGACDYWKLAEAMTFNNLYYYPLQLDAVRDFSASGTHIGGGWFGGYTQMWRAARDGLHHAWWIWNTILRGANAVWVFKGAPGHSLDCSVIAPDFTFYDFMDDNIHAVRLLKGGVGKLLLASERRNDRVAILYSPVSMMMTTFTEGLPANWDEPASMPSVFAEADFQYRLISTRQLTEGILEQGGFRVLFLPYCQALSPEEVKAILAFARNGGTVVADLRPGVCDAHGKPYETSPLDELFGVRQNTTAAMATRARVDIDLHEPTPFFLGLPETLIDGSLTLAGGKALGRVQEPDPECEAPAVVVNAFGKGQGILLNLAFSEYLQSRHDSFVRFVDNDKARKTRTLLQFIFEKAGVTPEVLMAPHAPGSHAYRFASGGALFVGLLWDAPAFLPGVPYTELYDRRREQAIETIDALAAQRQDVTVTFPQETHVYDMLAGEYLGHARAVSRTIAPGRVQMLAALPYRVSGVDVSVKNKSVRPGDALVFSAAVRPEGGEDGDVMHVFRVQLVDPEGRAVPHYATNVRAPGGRCEGSVTLALNDPTGKWELVIRDVATGVTSQTPFEVTTR